MENADGVPNGVQEDEKLSVRRLHSASSGIDANPPTTFDPYKALERSQSEAALLRKHHTVASEGFIQETASAEEMSGDTLDMGHHNISECNKVRYHCIQEMSGDTLDMGHHNISECNKVRYHCIQEMSGDTLDMGHHNISECNKVRYHCIQEMSGDTLDIGHHNISECSKVRYHCIQVKFCPRFNFALFAV